MDACVRLLRTGFEQIVELFVAPKQLLNRKHDVFSGTRPHSLLQCQNCVRADRLIFEAVYPNNEKIVSDKVVSEVVIRTAAGIVTSIITTGSVERMNLKEGDTVFAVIKATEMSVEKE